MEVTINGKPSDDPRDLILTVEAVTKSVCVRAGKDPAEGVMILLTAAVHLTRQYARPSAQIERTLAESLGAAIVAADGFFTLREAT